MLRGTVIFDEASFLSAEMLKVYGAFAIVNKSFKSGKDRDGNELDPLKIKAIPQSIPNQKFYISSASSTDTEFYKIYREFAKKQLVGDPDYFVAQIDCEVAFKPTIKGRVVSPLLVRSTVESEMATNPEKARREYFCEFTTDVGVDAIIKRGVIARNSETRAPLLYNDTNDKKFIFAYDPARQRDNAIILVMELYKTEKGEYKGRVVNCVNLLDVGKKIKSPMRTPEQLAYLRQMILDYNGDAPDYDNIECILIDAGAGGGGVNLADFLMEDWVDKKGVQHRGLIDREYSSEYVARYPNAINKVKLVPPKSHKSIIYESLIEMLDMDAISFTADYDNKGYLTVFESDERKINKEKKRIEAMLRKQGYSDEELDKKMEEELMHSSIINTKVIELDPFQEIALANIDAAKEEMISMVRKKRESGQDSFELAPEKQNRLHDDRSYCMALAAWYLHEKRMEHIKKRKRDTSANKELLDSFVVYSGKHTDRFFA